MSNIQGNKGRSWKGTLFQAYHILIIVLGAALFYQGGLLLLANGSPYYAVIGLVIIISSMLMIAKRKVGLYLFALGILGTYGWALWEVGFNGFALVPRLAWLGIVGFIFLTFLPVAKTWFGKEISKSWWIIFGAFPLVMTLSVLIPICFPNTIQLANPELASERPAAAFSRDALSSPDGNIAGSHDATNWTAYAGSNMGNHYSPATQITPENASTLVKVWEYHHGDLKKPGEKIKYMNEATPIKVGDALYTCTPKQIIVAISATTGKELWRHESTNDPAYFSQDGAKCRGVSYYKVPDATGLCSERIIWGTNDLRLGAVDAKTGESCPAFGTNGYVDLKPGTGDSKFRKGADGVTSAPLIVRGLIITSSHVIDADVRPAPSGVVRAYDAVTGQLRWAWDLGNENGPLDLKNPQFTESTPNVWAPMSADDELGLIYVTTGNAAGDFFGGTRTPEEEKYTDSLVAIDAQTGKVRWHFQTVHHDLWDYDLSPQPNLIDFPLNGKTYPAVIQATKSGQIYILDRTNGKPLSDIKEMPVPQGSAPGDHTSPTQPMSVDMPTTMGRPSKKIEVLKESDAWGLTPFDQMSCRKDFVTSRYEGYFTPPMVGKKSIQFPGQHGGLNWGGVMVDLKTGIMVINTQRLPYRQESVPRKELDSIGAKSWSEQPGESKGFRVQQNLPYGAVKTVWMSPLKEPCIAPPWGFISGIDLRTKDVIWSRPMGTGYDSGPLGISSHTKFQIGTPSDGTGVVTAGGVTIIGAGLDHFMRAYNSSTGELLWETRIPAGNQASPLTYMANGRQYVVAVVGGNDAIPSTLGDSIIAWALPEKSK